MCFANGLGAPIGSILASSYEFIETAKRYRKWFGGTMHQSGVIAAACLYSLKYIGINQIRKDHDLATQVYNDLTDRVDPRRLVFHNSNMILISCDKLDATNLEITNALETAGILVLPWTDNSIRLVFHRGVSQKQTLNLGSRIAQIFDSFDNQKVYNMKAKNNLHIVV